MAGFRRRSRALGYAAFAAAAALTARSSLASLIIDVRAELVNGAGVNDRKLVLVHNAGDTVQIAVFARIIGTNGSPDEMLSAAHGSLSSGVGPLQGNLAGGRFARVHRRQLAKRIGAGSGRRRRSRHR